MTEKDTIVKIANAVGLIVQDNERHKHDAFYQGELSGVKAVLYSMGYQYLNLPNGFALKNKDANKVYSFDFTNHIGKVELRESHRRLSRKSLREDYEDDYDDESFDKEELIKEGKKAIKAIKPQDLESDVEWLWDNDDGCVHYKLFDTENYEYDLCIGWSECYDEDEEDDTVYQEGSYGIVARFGRQSFNNGMQTDLDWDFEMPWKESEDSGEPYDNTVYIGRDEDYAKLLRFFEDDVETLVDVIL